VRKTVRQQLEPKAYIILLFALCLVTPPYLQRLAGWLLYHPTLSSQTEPVGSGLARSCDFAARRKYRLHPVTCTAVCAERSTGRLRITNIDDAEWCREDAAEPIRSLMFLAGSCHSKLLTTSPDSAPLLSRLCAPILLRVVSHTSCMTVKVLTMCIKG
jgi:hypothetical protein